MPAELPSTEQIFTETSRLVTLLLTCFCLCFCCCCVNVVVCVDVVCVVVVVVVDGLLSLLLF